jgi:NTE family protein
MASPTLREWLREGEFTLGLSSGFFGFFAHAGVLRVLEDEGLLPSALSGSSAGALVTGLWASGLDATAIERELKTLERAHFWDPWPGPGLLRGRKFQAKLESLMPVRTFEACRRPLSISVFEVASRRTRVVTSGDLATAVRASCALPGLFHPVRVDGVLCSDGGVLDRPGLDGVGSGARVLYHHLASKSPWRRAADPQLQVPTREGMRALVIDGLPRVNPFKLHAGERAFDAAARATRAALARPTDGAIWREAS